MSITQQHPSRERPVLTTSDTSSPHEFASSKVPEVVLTFWIIKGRPRRWARRAEMHFGYALSTAIFFTLFTIMVAAQVASKSFHPFLYWGVIVATTTAGTTMADFADRSLGIGYFGGSLILWGQLRTACCPNK